VLLPISITLSIPCPVSFFPGLPFRLPLRSPSSLPNSADQPALPHLGTRTLEMRVSCQGPDLVSGPHFDRNILAYCLCLRTHLDRLAEPTHNYPAPSQLQHQQASKSTGSPSLWSHTETRMTIIPRRCTTKRRQTAVCHCNRHKWR
jgi:hypothetical protein